jgi:uncharacterized protein (TIGR02145 family)
MKPNRSHILAAGVVLAMAFTSCSSGDDGGGPNPNPGGTTYSYCVYSDANMCSSGPFTECQNGGILSNDCPFTSGNTLSSSSVTSQISGFCDYGPVRPNGDGGCFPMSTEDDLANCAAWGQVVSSCPTYTITSSSSVIVTPSSSSTPRCNAEDNTGTHYCSNGSLREYGRVTVSSQTYKTVVIGKQTWMAEDLKGGLGGRGHFFSPFYAYDDSFCPSGWHLPTDDEWDVLTNFVEADSRCFDCAGKKLKASSGWSSNGNGTNDYGFSALPKGYYRAANGSTPEEYNAGVDKMAVWWANSCSDGGGFCNYRALTFDSDEVFQWEMYPVGKNPALGDYEDRYSIRCVKD